MPYYYLHSIYYDYYLYRLEEDKKTDEQKGAEALGRAIEEAT